MNERTMTIVTVAVLIGAVLAGGGVAYFFHSTISEKERELSQLKAEVQDAQQKRSQIPQLIERIDGNPAKNEPGLKNEIKKANERVPRRDELQDDDLANLLDRIRKQSATHISDAKFSPPARGPSGTPLPPTFQKVNYKLNVEGTFFNVLRFINLLEAEKRFIQVEAFSITPEATETATLPLRKLTIEFNSFTRLDPLAPSVPTSTPERPTEVKVPTSTPLPN